MAFVIKITLKQGEISRDLIPFVHLDQFPGVILGPTPNGLLALDLQSQNQLFLVNSGLLGFEIATNDNRIILPGTLPPPDIFKLRNGGLK